MEKKGTIGGASASFVHADIENKGLAKWDICVEKTVGSTHCGDRRALDVNESSRTWDSMTACENASQGAASGSPPGVLWHALEFEGRA